MINRSHLPAIVLLSVFFPLTSTAAIIKGPYLQSPQQHSITVDAEVDDGSDCIIKWGDNLENTSPMVGESPHREVRIKSLKASTCYRYHVECGADTSPEASFCTAPTSEEPFRVVIFGDTRSDHQAHSELIDAIAEENPDVFFNTGDLVSDGQDEDEWNEFFNIEGELLRDVPMMPVVGNHDEHNGEIPIYGRLFSVPMESSGVDNYYSVTYGNAHFIILDNQADNLGRPKDNTSEGQWLENELQSSSDNPALDFIFVLVHENMYSVKDGRAGDEGLRLWRDKFVQLGVDAVISGHDHHYVRGWADNGLPFVGSGGGGAPLYDVSEDFATQGQEKDVSVWGWLPEPGDKQFKVIWTKKEHNYLVLDFQGKTLDICAKEVPTGHTGKGISFDCWTYEKGQKPEPDQKGDEKSGCGCRSQGTSSGAILLGGVFLAVLFRRKLRRSR